jgi:hypothetical protein
VPQHVTVLLQIAFATLRSVGVLGIRAGVLSHGLETIWN